MEEIWKDVVDYEGIYQVSSLGRIRSVDGKTTTSSRFGGIEVHWKSRIIKQQIVKSSRGSKRLDARVKLWKDKKMTTFLTARVVAMAFVDGYKEGYTVDHINSDSLDNRACNLQWMSLAENIKKGFRDGRYPSRGITLYKNGDYFHFISFSEASRFVGCNNGYISCLLGKGKRLTHNGYEIVDVEEAG